MSWFWYMWSLMTFNGALEEQRQQCNDALEAQRRQYEAAFAEYHRKKQQEEFEKKTNQLWMYSTTLTYQLGEYFPHESNDRLSKIATEIAANLLEIDRHDEAA